MKLRTVALVVFILAALTAPLASQQAGKVWRIGFLEARPYAARLLLTRS
jgi:hypothetical protein